MINKLRKIFRKELVEDEQGFSLLDVLTSTTISSVVAMGLTQSAMLSFHYNHKSVVDSVATQLALETLEDYALIDPEPLDNDSDVTELSIQRAGITFQRQIDVTINPDRSRQVDVTVTATATKVPSEVQLGKAFALWGER